MRIAFLADLHGNLLALESVIADLQRQSPDAVYLVGDQINRCPWHNEVLDCLEEQGWPAVAGNHEEIIGRIGTPENRPPFTQVARFPTLWWTQAQLTSYHLDAIRRLPIARHLIFPQAPSIYLTHGIPGHTYLGLYPEDSDQRFRDVLKDVPEAVVVCAHTHRPLVRQLPEDSPAIFHYPHLILNPGSVGMPYNGDPRAQYMLLELTHGAWLPHFRRVSYDLAALAHAFDQSKMAKEAGPEVELHLRTAMTGLPWSSDFSFWLGRQPFELQQNLSKAVPIYLAQHGPGNWSFY